MNQNEPKQPIHWVIGMIIFATITTAAASIIIMPFMYYIGIAIIEFCFIFSDEPRRLTGNERTIAYIVVLGIFWLLMMVKVALDKFVPD